MKRLIMAVIALVMMTATGFSATKVLERSEKKVPEWLSKLPTGYEIVSVEGATLAECQTRALSELTERIIKSVALNIKVTDKMDSQEELINGTNRSYESYKHVSETVSANLPFLKGISLSKAEGTYWERVREKDSGKEYYNYSIKYPYSESEHQALIKEFEELDSEKQAELTTLKNRYDNVSSVEEIDKSISELALLSDYFFDKTRLDEVSTLTDRYKQLYGLMTVDGEFTSDSTYECWLQISGRRITSGTLPKVKSNCAAEVKARLGGRGFIISFDAIDCLEDEENTLTLTFTPGGKKLSHTAYIHK